jgi:predicted nucleic acid-binding protein
VPIWISDTSPICYFARLGLLDVLHKLLGRILVPMAVVDEIDRGRAFIPELPDLRLLDWVDIEIVADNISDVSSSQLGPGETEALVLAESLSGVCLLMDDFQAREQAMKSGISVRGTLALLLMAKEKKYVQEVGSLIDQLKKMGFRLSDSLQNTVLSLARED